MNLDKFFKLDLRKNEVKLELAIKRHQEIKKKCDSLNEILKKEYKL